MTTRQININRARKERIAASRWPAITLAALALGCAIAYAPTTQAGGTYCGPYSCTAFDLEHDRRDERRKAELDRRDWEESREQERRLNEILRDSQRLIEQDRRNTDERPLLRKIGR